MYGFYFAHCTNIIFNSLLAQLVKYDVHKTRKMKSIHAISYHILLLYCVLRYSAVCLRLEVNAVTSNVYICVCVLCYINSFGADVVKSRNKGPGAEGD